LRRPFLRVLIINGGTCGAFSTGLIIIDPAMFPMDA
jgi:hypothetical protein